MRKYRGKKSLLRAVDGYFSSVSKTEPVTEEYDTGEVNEKGKPVIGSRGIINDRGEEIRKTEYIIPPTVSGLCLYLGIDGDTWESYCDTKLHPEFKDVTALAGMKMEAYLEEQLLTREKSIQGIMFSLQNNFGWGEKKEAEKSYTEERSLTLDEKLALIEKAGEDIKDMGLSGGIDE